jgi:hypothetical protein
MMRPVHALLVLPVLAFGIDTGPARAQAALGVPCSVFARHPCAPTVCSVFRRRPCMPGIEYPFGETLQLTITTSSDQASARSAGDDPDRDDSEHKLNTIRDLFAALRGCWVPPPEDEARPGMQMSVRLSFKRSGEIIGTPRVTYVTPGAPPDARDLYRNAITAALERCTPLPFTNGLGGAIAGRPIAIRYVDNRTHQ